MLKCSNTYTKGQAMQNKIINLLADLLADQYEMEVYANEVHISDSKGTTACRLHGAGYVGSNSDSNSEVTA